MINEKPVEMQETELEKVNGGWSWCATNEPGFKNADGILDTRKNTLISLDLDGGEGNDLLIGGDGIDV